jgi:hypothetical protein
MGAWLYSRPRHARGYALRSRARMPLLFRARGSRRDRALAGGLAQFTAVTASPHQPERPFSVAVVTCAQAPARLSRRLYALRRSALKPVWAGRVWGAPPYTG